MPSPEPATMNQNLYAAGMITLFLSTPLVMLDVPAGALGVFVGSLLLLAIPYNLLGEVGD